MRNSEATYVHTRIYRPDGPHNRTLFDRRYLHKLPRILDGLQSIRRSFETKVYCIRGLYDP